MNMHIFKWKLLRFVRRCFYQIFKIFVRSFKTMPKANTTEKIDIIIPVIEKDLHILPLCLEGIRKCINNHIDNIYIVAPHNENIIEFSKRNNLTYIDELSVLGYSADSLKLMINNIGDRSGWLFQQLIKLSGNIGDNRYFIVIDSDHILIRPHTFLTLDNNPVFYMSHESHYPYYENYKRLFGYFPFSTLSYVSHKMIFDKEELKKYHAEIEKKHPNLGRWDKIIRTLYNKNELSGFSEFECYGHFYSKEKIRFPWFQQALYYKQIDSYVELKKRYERKCLSLTFPAYFNN